MATFSVLVVLSSSAGAQTTNLGAGGAESVWRGTQAGSRAGESLDQGDVSAGDGRKDLIIGAPGGPGLSGAVYIIFGRPIPSGDFVLDATADTVIRSATTNDRFGSTTAAGHVLTSEGSGPRTLIVSAPAALSNRGIVYVFAGGFHEGDNLTTADAVVEIRGAAGDQLGTALATGDLNNDGYREIIIGAPGTGRVYVIAGGPTLSGTIDLSVPPIRAALAFAFAGFGGVLAAGDITGDGVYDLLFGQPGNNAIYVIKGNPDGSMPSADFDMVFSGIDAGDNAGSAIRLADVDSDGITDVAISAPGGDGPANTRANAGEVYLLYGGATLGSRSLASANVTFYGRDANSLMGGVLAGGDVNRDTPNDLVFGAPGGHGGAGSIDIYYGRGRNSIGVPQANGLRIVDFANETPDRAVLGDTAGGTITAIQVFEVTGEGARDVIVGMSGNSSTRGAVYFTISPRLTLGASNVSLSGFQGIVSSSPVAVRNISEIAITWSTSSNRPWLSATAQGSTSASSFGDVVVTANGDGLPPGTHTGTITVTSTSRHLRMSQTIAVSFQVRETQPSAATPPAGGFPSGNVYKIFWRHNVDGWLAFWHMNGLTLTRTSSLSVNQMASAAWRVAGMGDLNGDGQDDIVWQNESDGRLAVWFLNGTQVLSTNVIGTMTDPTWKIRGVGDTDGDRKADLLWQNTADGRLAVWYMDGRQVRATIPLSISRMPTPNWFIKAVGDTNGDGRADIIWHKADTGELAVWFLNGWGVTGTHRLSIGSMTDTAWEIVGTEDVNGDGKSDILWQHATGTLATWYLDGQTVIGTLKLNPSRVASTAWRIAGPK